MKNPIKIHRNSKKLLVIGTASVIAMLIASTVLYLGAGRMFDYYTATDVSEKLLAGVRPLSVGICIGSIGTEYLFRKRNDNG